MPNCEDCPDWEEIYMSEMKKPEKAKAIPIRKVQTKKPGSTGPRGSNPARNTGDGKFNAQSTDSNNG